MDSFDPRMRSEIMRRVRSHSTAPEMAVRRLLHSLGYRYRLHALDLPGKPDIVFRRRKKVVQVHGCFWHQHPGCSRGERTPASNKTYWEEKLRRNRKRDARNLRALSDLGWEAVVVWECETKDAGELVNRLIRFLGPPRFDFTSLP